MILWSIGNPIGWNNAEDQGLAVPEKRRHQTLVERLNHRVPESGISLEKGGVTCPLFYTVK